MANPSSSRGRPRGRPRTGGAASADAASGKQAIIRLQLDLPAKHALDDLCERRGMTQIAALSRIAAWLVKQDEVLQAWVLNLMREDHLSEISKILLKRLSEREVK